MTTYMEKDNYRLLIFVIINSQKIILVLLISSFISFCFVFSHLNSFKNFFHHSAISL